VGNLVLDWDLRIPGTNVMASPAVWTDADLVRRVFVASGSDVRSVDAATGHVLWEESDPFGDIPFPEITLAKGAVYVASYNMGNVHFGNVYALDATTGAVLWKLSMQNWSFSTPAVANGLVYVRCDERSLCALDAGTGVILWEFTAAVGDILCPPAVAGDLVYFCASNPTLTYVYALDAATGALVWRRPIGTLSSTQNSSTSTPAVGNGVVYIGLGSSSPQRGELHAFNANTGAPLWSYKVAGQIDSSPAVAHGVVYFGSSNLDREGFSGDIYALDADAGALLWKYHTENVVV
jgi:outer membrane protein assembly factor BamB